MTKHLIRRHGKPILDRIQEKTMVIGECKIFIGSRGGQGYGRIKYNGKNETVHRIIAHLFLGLDLSDPKQCACHKKECTSRACWNVEHIYVGTHDQNMQDKR